MTIWFAIAILAAAHALYVLLAIVLIAYPNPLRRFVDRDPSWRERLGARTIPATGPNGPFRLGLVGPGPPRPVVLLAHGRSRRASWMVPIAEALAPDHDVALYDQRHHGERGLGTTTLGGREADDVDAAIDALVAGGYDRIVLAGISIGAASALRALERRRRPEVRAVVSIGCFDDLDRFLRVRTKRWRLPWILQPLVRAGVERLAGFRFADVSPLRAVPRLDVPVHVIHAREDELVPPSCAEALATAAGTSPVWYEGRHDHPENRELQAAVREAVASGLRELAPGSRVES